MLRKLLLIALASIMHTYQPMLTHIYTHITVMYWIWNANKIEVILVSVMGERDDILHHFPGPVKAIKWTSSGQTRVNGIRQVTTTIILLMRRWYISYWTTGRDQYSFMRRNVFPVVNVNSGIETGQGTCVLVWNQHRIELQQDSGNCNVSQYRTSRSDISSFQFQTG